jgi:hypothetical protein
MKSLALLSLAALTSFTTLAQRPTKQNGSNRDPTRLNALITVANNFGC